MFFSTLTLHLLYLWWTFPGIGPPLKGVLYTSGATSAVHSPVQVLRVGQRPPTPAPVNLRPWGMMPEHLGRVVLTDISPRPPRRGLLNPCSLYTTRSATPCVLGSDALPGVANPAPARSEHRGYMYAGPGALPESAFFGRNDKKRLHHSHRCSLESRSA